MNLEAARALADAVLLEGYALYPYRASAPKNRYRWTFGVLAPRAWSEAGGCEAWWLEAQLLIAPSGEARPRLGGHLRFFQIERGIGPAPWDEGVLREVALSGAGGEQTFELPAERRTTIAGTTERRALAGRIVVRRERVDAARPLERLVIRVENESPWSEPAAPRAQAIAAAFASTHLVLGVEDGELLSAIDPPAWAGAAAATCRSTRTYPVLVGPPGSGALALAAPFILPDHPQLAPESTGDLCDATEIDELLLLRTRTLTPDEKREARATDPRTAAIVERADAVTERQLARMHGATRGLRDGEMTARDPRIGRKVRLRPAAAGAARRTDAQDLLYAGRLATIADVRHDVDGTVYLAVTIDDDPAAELHDWYGRYHHYRADEVELL